ncbi:LLM class flavin-dependent oxidoreductase [Mesorhizobium sp. YC-39]|uniref:LLM class flavin-dependent oxidoreductase n=1 Tax=unclassified Mesorhizobium TaxID=325217 RepID=UPI0021E8351F|nr:MULTISPECIES: LLM class flavin-dependent oxidoreductase [unclassified Mesorhizobium]MCV3205674.1 LLM class flavin-dependent oxidoreductase [Mesorhizobium sp. YC-2]MCV3227927.1 LLM class flavin-dependent oxidoreductase [Mesorhizobium sp. YC-39]
MKRMILSAFFFNPQGDHRISWRHPNAPSREIYDLPYFQSLAAVSEAAKLDAIFVADHVGMWDTYESNIAHYANPRLEPITLLSALSAVTSHIGLLATASASYTEPYNLARMFASLDHLSHGRAGWNVVTSSMAEEAMNFGHDGNIDHANRYERAGEYVDVVKALWDSIEDDAILLDRESGLFADPRRIHRINHAAKYLKVRGPLNVPRPPQGHPVIVQAGSSDDGKNLAARHADVHFAVIRSVEEGQKYRADFDTRLERAGRVPEDLKILPGIHPVVASSRDEAREKEEFLQTLVPERIGVDLVSSWCGIDVSGFPIDGPLPPLPDIESYDGQRSNLERMKAFAAQGLSIRDVAHRLINAGAVPSVTGTPADVADQLEEWFTAGAGDGFNLMFPLLPEDLVQFCTQVVPELQRRGLAQSEYAGATLRDRLGLRRPPNRFDRA